MSRAIVMGGGADALVAAQVLARGGHEVMVIESHASSAEAGWTPAKAVNYRGVPFHPGAVAAFRAAGANPPA